MTYNRPKRDNCDRGSHPVLNIRMCMYVHYYLHKMFHVEHCTYNCCTVSVRVPLASVDERGDVAGAEAVIDVDCTKSAEFFSTRFSRGIHSFSIGAWLAST